MQSIIKNTINSCFIVWLKIFEPIKSKKEVLSAERYDKNTIKKIKKVKILENKKERYRIAMPEKWIVVRSRKTKEIEFKPVINKKENKKR